MIRVISVVSNDIVTDNRIHKIACTLSNNGYEVLIVGRKRKHSLPLTSQPYKTRRLKLLVNKGPLFYANLNIRLFFFLLLKSVDIILANDLDTLQACSLVSRIRKKKLIFDSHELFPEVPELVHRPFVRKIWLILESRLIRKIDSGLTVCNSIAKYYQDKYQVSFETIRNLSLFKSDQEIKKVAKNNDGRIIIYQGALNLGRGIELAIESMKYIDNARLWIIGDGDIRNDLMKLTSEQGLTGKVEFKGRIPVEFLWKYTAQASIGISLEEDLGLNYQYALPNKLFDYIQARIPVIISNLPEMTAIVNAYKIGSILTERTPQKLAELVNSIVASELTNNEFNTNIEKAARELCWEKEEMKLLGIVKRLHA